MMAGQSHAWLMRALNGAGTPGIRSATTHDSTVCRSEAAVEQIYSSLLPSIVPLVKKVCSEQAQQS